MRAPPCKTRREALVTLFPTASESKQCLHGLSRRSANDNVPICHCHETLCRAGTCPCRCRNYRLRTCLFVCTVCRFAVGGDMSPPYRGWMRASARRCRNNRLRTVLFACTVCCFVVLSDMSRACGEPYDNARSNNSFRQARYFSGARGKLLPWVAFGTSRSALSLL